LKKNGAEMKEKRNKLKNLIDKKDKNEEDEKEIIELK